VGRDLAKLTLRDRHQAAIAVLRRQDARELTIEERRDLLILVVWPELFSDEHGEPRQAA
jgi:hypothetical protein